MRMFIIDAWVLDEQVNLFHKPSSQKLVDKWLKENQQRLSDKGFSRFEVNSYLNE